MHIAEGPSVSDFPVPPTGDEIAASFPVPLFGLVAQPSIAEAGFGTVSSNDGVHEVAISYSLFRNPADHNDPSNYTDDAADILSAIDAAERKGQPEWFVIGLRRMRFPVLWEAVSTVITQIGEPLPLADRLAAHINHVVMNTCENRRHESSTGPATLENPVHADDALPGRLLQVDGADVSAIQIDTDVDATGWAFETAHAAVLVVLRREHLPLVDVRLERRQPSG
jgi:hypothetical protein